MSPDDGIQRWFYASSGNTKSTEPDSTAAAGMPVFSRRGILGDDEPAVCLDVLHPVGGVRTAACQDNGDKTILERGRGRFEQGLEEDNKNRIRLPSTYENRLSGETVR